jgi:hypothetical protein
VAYSAHGGNNEYLLQTSSEPNPTGEHASETDYVCLKCHINGNYDDGGGDHSGSTSNYKHTSDQTGTNRSTTSNDGHITGIACLNCHDGTIGFGGIHGFPDATFTASSNNSDGGLYNKRRFLPGSGLDQYDPHDSDSPGPDPDVNDAAWQDSGNQQCYTLGTASSFSVCNQHTGMGTSLGKRNIVRDVDY